jgi:hypothetical protein
MPTHQPLSEDERLADFARTHLVATRHSSEGTSPKMQPDEDPL